jgi:hypothetical protein
MIPDANAENAGHTEAREKTRGKRRDAPSALKHQKKAGTLHLLKVIQPSRRVQARIV